MQKGFRVTGYDVSEARAAAAAKDGVAIAKSPAAAAEAADVVMSSLPNPATVRAAYLGADGAVPALRAGTILVDMSTIDPSTWRDVADAAAARGAESLGAPVSGGPADAGSGRLVFLVGGDAAVIERCRPVLEALGTEIHHLGPLGAGHVVKLVNNVMSMCNVAVAAEAMVLGRPRRHGPAAAVRRPVDQRRPLASFPEALPQRAGRRFHAVLQHRAVAEGPLPGPQDGRRAWEFRCSPPRPCARSTRPRPPQGLDNADMAGVTKLYEQWAGVKVRATQDPKETT